MKRRQSENHPKFIKDKKRKLIATRDGAVFVKKLHRADRFE